MPSDHKRRIGVDPSPAHVSMSRVWARLIGCARSLRLAHQVFATGDLSTLLRLPRRTVVVIRHVSIHRNPAPRLPIRPCHATPVHRTPRCNADRRVVRTSAAHWPSASDRTHEGIECRRRPHRHRPAVGFARTIRRRIRARVVKRAGYASVPVARVISACPPTVPVLDADAVAPHRSQD